MDQANSGGFADPGTNTRINDISSFHPHATLWFLYSSREHSGPVWQPGPTEVGAGLGLIAGATETQRTPSISALIVSQRSMGIAFFTYFSNQEIIS